MGSSRSTGRKSLTLIPASRSLVSAALKGKKAASKKAAPRKAAAKKAPMTKAVPKNVAARKRGPEKAGVKKAAPKKVAPKKQAAVPKPRQVENLIAGAEVPRKFTMTVQVSGREFLDDPVAATR